MGGEIREGAGVRVLGVAGVQEEGREGGRLMRGRDSQILGLGAGSSWALLSRQGADICRWGQVQVARECKVTAVVHISDQEAEGGMVAQGWVCSAEWERPAPRSQGGRRAVQGITG